VKPYLSPFSRLEKSKAVVKIHKNCLTCAEAEMSLEVCATAAAGLFSSNREALEVFFAHSAEEGWRVRAPPFRNGTYMAVKTRHIYDSQG